MAHGGMLACLRIAVVRSTAPVSRSQTRMGEPIMLKGLKVLARPAIMIEDNTLCYLASLADSCQPGVGEASEQPPRFAL